MVYKGVIKRHEKKTVDLNLSQQQSVERITRGRPWFDIRDHMACIDWQMLQAKRHTRLS